MINIKRAVSRLLVMGIIFPISSIVLFSCGNKDASIQAAIETKQKESKELAGITATVDKGVVTLSGESPDTSSKAISEQAVSSIPGVKKVINNLTVAPPPAPPAPAPVVIAADDPLTKSVADAIKDYPGVSAAVKDGEITLTGDIKRASLQKLVVTLHSLKPRKINNQLTIK